MTTLLGLLLLFAAPPQQPPLPGIEAFKQDVLQIVQAMLTAGDSLQSKSTPVDDGELLQYAYTEKETKTKLDSKGRSKGTETNLYQVTRGPESWQFYRKLISSNGVTLSAAELAKQDEEQKSREATKREEIAREIEAARKAAAKRKPNPAPAVTITPEQQLKLQVDSSFEYLAVAYDPKIVRRETLDGHATVVIELKPKTKFKTKDDFLNILHHVLIRGWVRELDHKLVRMEADVIDTISFGWGLLAKFQKGSRMLMERRPINEEIWAPVKIDATLNARILVLKGMNERQVSEYSDFKKYTVETKVKVIDTSATPK